MEHAINANGCAAIMNETPRQEPTPGGVWRWFGGVVETYLYPDIHPGDNRIAEYIPPRMGPGRG